MGSGTSDSLEMFSRAWYDEYFRRAVSSRAHSLFCERVYGLDLCQHGLMDAEELDFLVSLIEPGARVLEVGCSNGYITEYIQARTGASILGIDFSGMAIEQARQRTRDRAGALCFERVDLKREPIPGDGYDYAVLIDSLYFLGEFEESLPKVAARLGAGGRMILSVFQVKEEGDPEEVLQPDHTFLAQALRRLGYGYTWHDFTENVRRHGPKNYQVAEELKAAFEAEGNVFLYEARAAENRFFREAAEAEEIVRYLYVVEPA